MTEQALDQILVDLHLTAEDFYRPRHQLIFRAMVRLKQKAEPEAIDAITVCDDLRRENLLEEAGGQAYVHSLPTLVPSVHAVRDYAKIVRDHSILRKLLVTAREIQDRVDHRGRRSAGAGRAGRAGDLPRRPRRGLEPAALDRGRAPRRARQARAPVEGGHEPHRHALGLQGPRRDHRRLPARQPDRAGGEAGDGQIGPRHQHRRERLRRPRQGGRAVLARDVRGRARPAVHRLPGQDQRRAPAQGPGQGRAVAEGAGRHGEAHEGARCSSTTRATSACSSCARRRAGCTTSTRSGC